MWPSSEPFVLAHDAGELPTDKLKLVELNWDSTSLKALESGHVDAAIWSLDEVLRQTVEGYPLKVVLVTDISRGADAILAREGIKDLSQLKGKRVGFEPRTASAFILEQGLRSVDLSLQDLQQVHLSPVEEDDFFGGLMLDAVATSSPWLDGVQKVSLNTVFSSSATDAGIIRVLAVRAEAVKTHRDAIRALVKAYQEWMPRLRHLNRELEPVLRREGLSREAFLNSISRLEIPSLEQNKKWLNGTDPLVLNRISELVPHITETALHISHESIAGILDASFLEDLP